MHSYFAEDGFALADGLIAAAEVYTATKELVAEVALAGFEKLVHFGAVLDAMLLVVAANSAYCCLVPLALDNP